MINPPTMPTSICANCGTTSGLEIVDVTAIVVRFLALGGTQWNVPLRLPACPGCRSSLTRNRPGPGAILGTWMVWTLVFFIACFAVPGLMLVEGGLVAAAVAVACSTSLVIVWYRVVRRPRGAQTTHWQPVWISKLNQRFSGEVVGATYAFSNEDYARLVVSENPGTVAFVRGSTTRVVWPATE